MIVALAGGVGGARLVDGLAQVLPEGELTVIVNTGDDFDHLGLRICPDLDTITYTLAGLADRARGWGVVDESFRALEMVSRIGGPAWFQLGDRDLGTHLYRRGRLDEGATLSAITGEICAGHGVHARLLPMSDDPSPTTIIATDGTRIPFQDWLVRDRASAPVAAVEAAVGAPAPGVIDAIEDADLVIIAPSNPYVSIDPILAVPGVRAAVAEKRVVAVSPIVGGKAVKGPLAGMLRTIAGAEPSAAAIAAHYGGLVDGLAVHPGDRFTVDCFAPHTAAGDRSPADPRIRAPRQLEVDIVIREPEARVRLARQLLTFAEGL